MDNADKILFYHVVVLLYSMCYTVIKEKQKTENLGQTKNRIERQNQGGNKNDKHN